MWTWQINSIIPNAGSLDYTLTYQVTDGVTVKPFTEPHVSATPPDDIKLTCIRTCQNAVDYLNKVDQQKQKVLTTDVAVLIGSQDAVIAAVDAQQPKPTPPTQDELDQQAFQQLLSQWRSASGEEANAAQMGLTVDSTSAAILAQIQKAFKPEYRSLLGGSRP